MPLEEKNTILESRLGEVFSGMSKQAMLNMSPRIDTAGTNDTNILGIDLDMISKTGLQSKVAPRSSRVPSAPWPTSRKADVFFASPMKSLVKDAEEEKSSGKTICVNDIDSEQKEATLEIEYEATFINPNSDRPPQNSAANLWSTRDKECTVDWDGSDSTLSSSVESSMNSTKPIEQVYGGLGSVSCPLIKLGSDNSFVESASSSTTDMPESSIDEESGISSTMSLKSVTEKSSDVFSDSGASIRCLDTTRVTSDHGKHSPSANSGTGLSTDSDFDSCEDQDVHHEYTNTVVDFVLEDDMECDDGGLRFAPPVQSSTQSHFSKKALSESTALSSGSSSFIQIAGAERPRSSLEQTSSMKEKWGTMSNAAYGSDAGTPPDSYLAKRDEFNEEHIPVYPRSRHMSWTCFDDAVHGSPMSQTSTDSIGTLAGSAPYAQNNGINEVQRQMSHASALNASKIIQFGPAGGSRTDHSKLKQTHSFATFGSERKDNAFTMSHDRIWGSESSANNSTMELVRGEQRSMSTKVSDWESSDMSHSHSQQSFHTQYVDDRETMRAQERDASYVYGRKYTPTGGPSHPHAQKRTNRPPMKVFERTSSSMSANGHPGNNYARYEDYPDSGPPHGDFRRHSTLPGSLSGSSAHQVRRDSQRQHTQPPQQHQRSMSSASGSFVHTSKHMSSGSSDSLQDFLGSYGTGNGSGKTGFSDSGTFSDSSSNPAYHPGNSTRQRFNSVQYERSNNHGNEPHRGGGFYNNQPNEYDVYNSAYPPPQPHNMNQQQARTSRRQFSFNGTSASSHVSPSGDSGWTPMRAAPLNQQKYPAGNKAHNKGMSSPRYDRGVSVNSSTSFMHQNMNNHHNTTNNSGTRGGMYSASSDYAPGYPYGAQSVGKNGPPPTARTAQRSMSLNNQRAIHIAQNEAVPKGRNAASRQVSELGTATRIQMSRTRGGSINTPTATNVGASSRFDNAIVWCDIDQGIEMASSVSSPFVNGRKVLYYFSRRTNRKTIMSLIEPSYLLGTPLENPEVNIGFLTFHDCVELRTLKTGEILTRNQRNNLRKRLATTARTIVQVDVPRLLNDFTDPDCCPRTAYHHSKLNAYLVSPAVIQVLLCTRENEIGAEPYLGHTIQVQTLFDLAKNESATRPLADFIKQSERNSTALNINIRDFKGMCPIHYAAKAGLAGTIDVLIREGADVNVVDKSEQSPLHYAIYNGHKDVQFQLLRAGAKLDTRNVSGNTLLHVAAYHNQLEIAEAILDKAPELLYLRNHKFNSTPLECAGHKTLSEMESLLGRRMARMSSMGLSGGSGSDWDANGEGNSVSWVGHLKGESAVPASQSVQESTDRVAQESSVLSMKMRAPGGVSSVTPNPDEVTRENNNPEHQRVTDGKKRVRTVSMHEDIFAANKSNNKPSTINDRATEGTGGLNMDCHSAFGMGSNDSLACVSEDVALETDEENYVLNLLMKTSLKVSEGLMTSTAGEE
ncbi:hypothetical protein SARC_03254 [Sphaeroforma arctica JP610]|uniref:Uncharacterized protein n=1 Tax=Sphaeroforma arctica JP610 TaxID=667725 RepID=A0A0L0G8G1_9EUKA|nr:hypothetical protein SARC_03254 [Sphaeroforma arctica JP610]KNC84528.1 hypothetical protein SARC_03254 [Sphaeroforma arctica JP610]|eukprot:XP_014158430.1 hypothetical protein SARC_03254 [Sphaeroforma arctica JP610]